MSLLDTVSTFLDRARVPHALIGATALAAAGVSRSTFDIDLLVLDRRCLETPFWAPLVHDALDVEVRRGDTDDPLAGVVRVSTPGERPIDIVVGKPAWQQRAIDRAIRRSGGPPVVQPRDLILLKLYAGGTQDLWDVRQLLSAAGGDSLAAAVAADLEGLPPALARAWQRVEPNEGTLAG